MQKFPSIEQFRNVIRNVQHRARFAGKDENDDPIYNLDAPLPKIEFQGTVKLHGTNGGIVQTGENPPEFQSRERVLSLTSDNAGFYAWGQQNLDVIEDLLVDVGRIGADDDFPLSTAIYGEWCGKGIQQGVAISAVDKMFVIFAVKVNDEWLDLYKLHDLNWDKLAESRIFLITKFPTWHVTIDFAKPELQQNDLVEQTMLVEKQCPVGAAFNEPGIGEGIVWKPVDPEWNESQFWFKVKGDKHQSSKVKTLAPVDVEAIKKVDDFIAYAVTESRLEQGLDNLIREQQKPFEMASLGDFIRWVFNDVVKEEHDVIVANGLDAKKLGGAVAPVARKWYIQRLNAKG